MASDGHCPRRVKAKVVLSDGTKIDLFPKGIIPEEVGWEQSMPAEPVWEDGRCAPSKIRYTGEYILTLKVRGRFAPAL